MSAIDTEFRSAKTAPVESIRKVLPEAYEPGECEKIIQVGLFFDGTLNNQSTDRPYYKESNVVRLYDVYPSPTLETYRFYVPGVGTPFPDIGEHRPSTGGGAFGIGCEARVLYALLRVQDAIHQAASNSIPFFNGRQIELLCSRGWILWPRDREEIGSDRGLLGHEDDNGARRRDYLKECARRIEGRLHAKKKPVIKHCIVDVFGFSRGAAEARVFCTWLAECLVNGKLAGVPVTLRFLGIFDTVAAAGLSGHDNWASAMALRVPDAVINCVHMIAMHEIRRNFPLDEVLDASQISRPRIEVAYPGSHSDLGGGYEPGELGIAGGSDASSADKHKLSQISLNHMYECAVAAGVPLRSRDDKTVKVPLRFCVAPEVAASYASFIDELGARPRQLFEWMSPYLAWRWRVRESYKDLAQYKNANKNDKELMLRANSILKTDADLLATRGDVITAGRHKTEVLLKIAHVSGKRNSQQALELAHLDDEAAVVLSEAMEQWVSPSMASFFDLYVHDSLAGFGTTLERSGYWRYRKSFRGTTLPKFASESDADAPLPAKRQLV
jgi:hypothetical protein